MAQHLPYHKGRQGGGAPPHPPHHGSLVQRELAAKGRLRLSVLFPLFRRGGIVNGHVQSNRSIFPIRISCVPAKPIFSNIFYPPYAAFYLSFWTYIHGSCTKIIVCRRILNPMGRYPGTVKTRVMRHAIRKKEISTFNTIIGNRQIYLIRPYREKLTIIT